ncbi:MAG: hypothetical protein IPG18_09565 [Saprospiraceae bacterium]|nr:hypothetical protein [Saprospiraceae bacterium]
MKSSVFILFCMICLIIPPLVTSTAIHYQKKKIKSEVKKMILSALDKNELEHLKFSQKEINTVLKWEHSQEFEYKGMMFDIVQTEIKGDSVFYLCWPDYEEATLKKRQKQIVSLLMSNDSHSKKSRKKLQDYFKQLFVNTTYSYPEYGSGINIKKQSEFVLVNDYHQNSEKPKVPPPESNNYNI